MIKYTLMSSRRRLALLISLPLLALLFALGFSVFLYLPIRSAQEPLLDWNHPAELSRFWGTLTRKTHGGTLDLVSAPYAKGENFTATFAFYLRHLWTGFAFLGIPLGLAGIYSLWKKHKPVALATLASWALCGPVFIYLANIPPNPHALVILEAHFLLPNLIFAFWIAEGFAFLFIKQGCGPATPATPSWRLGAGIVCGVILIAVNAASHLPDLNKRNNFICYDHTKNIFRSLPRHSIVVAKKDVQIFSLWNMQFVEGRRRDVAVVAQGLAGSFWYQKAFNQLHPGFFIGPLNSHRQTKTGSSILPATPTFRKCADFVKSLTGSLPGSYLKAKSCNLQDRGSSNLSIPTAANTSITRTANSSLLTS